MDACITAKSVWEVNWLLNLCMYSRQYAKSTISYSHNKQFFWVWSSVEYLQLDEESLLFEYIEAKDIYILLQ